MRSAPAGPAVWMMPNVLALDAPLVAVVWQWFLARQFSIPLPFVCCVVLALAAWSVYLLDRCLDAARGTIGTARHAFAARHVRVLLPLGMVCGVGAFACSPWAPSAFLLPGYLLALAVVGYLVMVHRCRAVASRVSRGKEVLVAICFGAGTCLILVDAQSPVAAAASALLFITACWCNCRLIDCWEGGGALRWGELALGLLLGAVGSLWAPAVVVLGSWSMAVLFAAVHYGVSRRNRELARCLVDFAMVVPVLWWAAS